MTGFPVTRTAPISRAEWVFILVLLLFAAGLRFAGIDYGQPDMADFPTDAGRGFLPLEAPIHPDEYFYVAIPVEMRARNRLHPDFFENPSFLINLSFIVNTLTGTGDATYEQIAGQNQRQFAPFPLYVMGRGFSALGGVLAAAAVYAAARRLTGRYGAAAAGLLCAVSLPMVQHAHYATTSSLAAGFAAAAVWASVSSLRRARDRRGDTLLLAAGAAAGLAAGNRYNAAGVGIVVAGAALLSVIRCPKRWRMPAVSVLLMALVFLATTPGILLAARKFVADFTYIFGSYTAVGVPDQNTPYGLLYQMRYLGLVAVGLPGLIVAVTGLVYLLWHGSRRSHSTIHYRRFWSGVLLLLFSVAYALVVLRAVRPRHSDQLLVPFIPVICLLAGVGVGWLLPRLRALRFRRFAGLTAAVALVLLVAQPLTFSLSFVQWIVQPDSRYLIQNWIYDNLPPGSRLYLVGAYNVPLDPQLYPSAQTFGSGQDLPPLDTLRASGFEYLVFSDAILHDVARSSELSSADYLARDQAMLEALNQLPVVARVQRPPVVGSDIAMHTASVWHQPGITVYCLVCTDTAG